jgi:hypothetical protein
MYSRICKKCGKEVFYKTEEKLKRAIKLNKICLSCSNSLKAVGDKNSMYGKKHKKETIEKIKEKRKSQKFLDDTKRKMSISAKKRLAIHNHRKGKLHNDITKEKMRIAAANRIHNNKWHPSFNVFACKVIQSYGEKYEYDFQHAMNGGEVFIKELGYWIDGYDAKKNVVIEYYEKKHQYDISKDDIRIKNIKNHLKCAIIILREWDETDANLINELKNSWKCVE